MNLPNKLTVIRIALVPVFVVFLLIESIPHHYLIALLIFSAAAITDHFDGKIAREQNLITDFGKFADPLADKILVMAAFICFIELGLTGAVVVILMLSREFIVTSFRLVGANKGTVIAANYWGKAKTVSQIVAILLVLGLRYVMELFELSILPNQLFGLQNAMQTLFPCFQIIGTIAVWIAAILTVLSGVIYVCDNRELIRQAK